MLISSEALLSLVCYARCRIPETHVKQAVSFIKHQCVQLGHELRGSLVLQVVHQAPWGRHQDVGWGALHSLNLCVHVGAANHTLQWVYSYVQDDRGAKTHVVLGLQTVCHEALAVELAFMRCTHFHPDLGIHTLGTSDEVHSAEYSNSCSGGNKEGSSFPAFTQVLKGAGA